MITCKKRADRDNPVLQLELKQKEKAAKSLSRETAAKEKAELAARDKAVKESQKATEKERRLKLTSAEKKAEITERKVQNALRKAALQHQSVALPQELAVIAQVQPIADIIQESVLIQHNKVQ